MKTITEILRGKKHAYAIVDEDGKILKKFKLKATAIMWIPSIKLNKREKLAVIEIEAK